MIKQRSPFIKTLLHLKKIFSKVMDKDRGAADTLDSMLAVHDKILFEKARMFSDPILSLDRKSFSHGVDFRKIPFYKMLKNIRKMFKMQMSFQKSEAISRKSKVLGDSIITDSDAADLLTKIHNMGIDDVGTTAIEPRYIFKDKGVPYKNVLVISIEMDKEKMLTAPSVECMMEVANAYGRTGNAANMISEYLESKGYGAIPGHSLGGSISYPEIAQKAGMGKLGSHGLLISKNNGPSNRISVVYTGISNLDEYIRQSEDYSWITDFCRECASCIRSCPTTAIHESVKIDKNGHGRCTDHDLCKKNFSEQLGCSMCIRYCPFTFKGYEKLKSSYQKNAQGS